MLPTGKRKLVDYVSLIMLLLILMAGFFSFLYVDITNTIDNANILLRALYRGEFLRFYELSVAQSQTDFAANYSIFIYLLVAVWQAPAFFLTHLAGVNYMTCKWALLWSKALILLFSVCVAALMVRIVLLCTEKPERARLSVFLYSSTLMMFYPVFICGQLEVISMTLMLWGIYQYLLGKSRQFYAAFFLAAPFKLFSMMLALPLILFREKHALKALLKWFPLSGLVWLDAILFRESPVHRYALRAQNRDVINAILGANVNLGRPIVFFILCYCVICLYAFLKKQPDRPVILHSVFLLWGSFLLFSAANTYWIYLLVPFCMICICTNKRFLRINILLESIGSSAWFLYVTAAGTNIFKDPALLSHLLLSSAVPDAAEQKYATLWTLFQRLEWNRFSPLFATVFVFCFLAIMVLTAPSLQKPRGEEAPVWCSLNIRPLLLAAAVGLIIYAYTAKTNPVAFNTLALPGTFSEENLLSPDEQHVFSQSLSFQDSRRLDELVLRFKNDFGGKLQRANMALLHVELWDTADKILLFSDDIGCSDIKSNSDLYINLKKTPVAAGKEYALILTGVPGNAYYHDVSALYVCLTKETVSLPGPLEIDGEITANSLLFSIR